MINQSKGDLRNDDAQKGNKGDNIFDHQIFLEINFSGYRVVIELGIQVDS